MKSASATAHETNPAEAVLTDAAVALMAREWPRIARLLPSDDRALDVGDQVHVYTGAGLRAICQFVTATGHIGSTHAAALRWHVCMAYPDLRVLLSGALAVAGVLVANGLPLLLPNGPTGSQALFAHVVLTPVALTFAGVGALCGLILPVLTDCRTMWRSPPSPVTARLLRDAYACTTPGDTPHRTRTRTGRRHRRARGRSAGAH